MELWKPAENYMGDSFEDYYVGPTMSRDSDLMAESNFEAALKMLGGESKPEVIVAESGHWAVGWIKQIFVHKDAADKVKILEEIEKKIEEYPVLDDDDYQEKELEELGEMVTALGNNMGSDLVDNLVDTDGSFYGFAEEEMNLIKEKKDIVATEVNKYLISLGSDLIYDMSDYQGLDDTYLDNEDVKNYVTATGKPEYVQDTDTPEEAKNQIKKIIRNTINPESKDQLKFKFDKDYPAESQELINAVLEGNSVREVAMSKDGLSREPTLSLEEIERFAIEKYREYGATVEITGEQADNSQVLKISFVNDSDEYASNGQQEDIIEEVTDEIEAQFPAVSIDSDYGIGPDGNYPMVLVTINKEGE